MSESTGPYTQTLLPLGLSFSAKNKGFHVLIFKVFNTNYKVNEFEYNLFQTSTFRLPPIPHPLPHPTKKKKKQKATQKITEN